MMSGSHKFVSFALGLFILFGYLGFSQAQDTKEKVITIEQLTQMFNNMRQNPGWDLSKPMLWGYFFTSSSRERLANAAPILEKGGYRIVDIHLSDKKDAQEPDLWWLHIEKIEIHTIDSLNARNQEFYRFAKEYNLDSYDGMDVGLATY